MGGVKLPPPPPSPLRLGLRRNIIRTFYFKPHSFICIEKCNDSELQPSKKREWYRVETLEPHGKILNLCNDRVAKVVDKHLAFLIKRRILNCSDLVAPQGRYHKKFRGLLSIAVP